MRIPPRSLPAVLCLLLASCTDPKAFRITGPAKHVEQDGRLGTVTHLDFTVYNPQVAGDSCGQLLDNTAIGAINSEDETGVFQVTFTDGVTNQTIRRQNFRVDPDLLFQHKQPVAVY